MIRATLLLALLLGAAVVVFGLAGEPGRASLEWLGWRADTTAVAAVCALLIVTFMAVTLWRVGLWLVEAPRRAALARTEARRRQGAEALTRGFLAAAAGDGVEARRLAQRAAELMDETPALVRLLSAQAAEAAGDVAAADAAYNAMLGFADLRAAAHRGLMQSAERRGDRAAALSHARAAYTLPGVGRWAWRALIEDRLEVGDWPAARALVEGALERKVASPIAAARARAALLAASAASLEAHSDARRRVQATEFALQSVKLAPGFPPAAVIAARLLAAEGKAGRAAGVLEQAWRLAPHPAEALAWRDLDGGETPKARARRFEALAALQPDHRESRLLRIERALLLREAAEARALAVPLVEAEAGSPSARLCALMARIAHAQGQHDEARAWMGRSQAAAVEPAWSDIDPQGRAFAYSAQDWARLVTVYAESGELIHPRLERRERTLVAAPPLPAAYEPTPVFLTPEAVLAIDPDEAALFEDPEPPRDDDPELPPSEPLARRARTRLGKPGAAR